MEIPGVVFCWIVRPLRQFASDAGTGLAAGAQAASIQNVTNWIGITCCVRCGDRPPVWKDKPMPLWRRLKSVPPNLNKPKPRNGSKNHLKVWERLNADANRKMSSLTSFMHLAQQVDAQFALIDLETGQMRDPVTAAAILRSIGKQLSQWKGRIYAKLSANLINWADNLFAYSPTLAKSTPALDRTMGQSCLSSLGSPLATGNQCQTPAHPSGSIARFIKLCGTKLWMKPWLICRSKG